MKKIYTYLAICLMIVSCNQVTIDHPDELVEVATTKVTLAEARL